MLIKRRVIYTSIGVGILFAKILIVTNWFINGDQSSYIEAYQAIGTNLLASLLAYKSIIDSTPNLHFILAFVSKQIGIEKFWFSVLTSLFLAVIWANVILKFFTRNYLLTFLVLNSFYFDVLYFSAERLKVGIIFIGLFLLNKKSFNLILSIGGHLQTALLLPVFKIQFKKRFLIPIGIISALLIYKLDLYTYILYKIKGYFSDYGGEIPIKTIILALPLLLNRRIPGLRWIAFYFILCGFILGDLRINIMLFLFLITMRHYNESRKLMVTFIVYFAFKSINFLSKGFLYGTGF